MQDLKERTIRGGMAKICSQTANFVLRTGSLMILARLLEQRDFGLVGMVTAVIGVLNLFKDFGLSTATVQRTSVTNRQISTLFWINIFVGIVLGSLALAISPFLASFYHEPKLVWVTIILGSGFLLNAAGVQHSAILQRQMRFTTLAVIETISILISVAVGIGMASLGYGYWALVGMTITPLAVFSTGAWICAGWIPGWPSRRAGIRSLICFGGTITLNGLIVYIAYNLEKVLLGRFWGAEALGIYGRAYQLINIPTENLNSATGGVAFAALSRVQDDPDRLKSYFLKGYSLILGLTLPITIVCSLFADDIILVLLGPKWNSAAPIFRLLAPTIFAFALINPTSWLLFSIGKIARSLKIAMVIAPIVISGYIIGLSHGPQGVALGYSVAMILWVLPHIAWSIHGTMISLRNIMQVLSRPLLSGVVAAIMPILLGHLYGQLFSPVVRLILGGALFVSVYMGTLLFIMGQKALYTDLIRQFFRRSSTRKSAMAST